MSDLNTDLNTRLRKYEWDRACTNELLTQRNIPFLDNGGNELSLNGRLILLYKRIGKRDPFSPPVLKKKVIPETMEISKDILCPQCDSPEVRQVNPAWHPNKWRCDICHTGFKHTPPVSAVVNIKPNYKLDTDTQIFFYEQEYYVFSNFSAFNLTWWSDNENGIVFPTSEHAYHWNKFHLHPDIQREILKAPSAHEAFKIARSYNDKRVSNWDEIKVNVMEGILQLKVKQHPYVKQKLLESGNRELIEDSWRDPYWGWGENKDGLNMLGKTWMKVREDLRAGKL